MHYLHQIFNNFKYIFKHSQSRIKGQGGQG